MALYTDRAHWAFHTPKAKGPVDKTRADASRAAPWRGWASSTFRPTRRRRAGAVSGSIARFRIGSSMSCASRGSPRSRRPTAIWRTRFVPQHNATFARAPARSGECLCAARATSISTRFSATKRTRVVAARQHRHARRARCCRSRRSPAGAVVPACASPCGSISDGRYTITRGAHRLGASSAPTAGLWTLPRPWTPSARPPPLGKRPDRVSHSAHRPRFEKAVRSLVKRKRTDHLSTTLKPERLS